MRRHVVLVAILNGLGQVAALGKSVLIAYFFGIGAVLDGYYLAQALPATLSGIAVGYFQTGFLPVYSTCLATGDTAKAARMLGRALMLAATVGLVVSVGVSIAAPHLVALLAAGRNPSEGLGHAATALQALAFLTLLNMVVDCLSLSLNAHGKFALAAAAPIANVATATLILLLAPEWGLHNLILGTLAGMAIQLLVTVVGAKHAGIDATFSGLAGERIPFEGGIAILPGLLFSNLSVFIPVAFAIRLGEGSVAALSFATRLNGAITQVAVIATSTVLLPHFANALAAGRPAIVSDSLRAAALPIALLGIVVTSWVLFTGSTLITIAFERGAFGPQSTALVAGVWVWLAVGLAPALWSTALAKALQAKQLGTTLSAIALLSMVTQAVGCAIGWALDSVNVLAFATSASYLVAALGCTVSFRSHFSEACAATQRLRYTVAPFAAATAIALLVSPNMPAFRESWPAGFAAAVAATALGGVILFRIRRAAG